MKRVARIVPIVVLTLIAGVIVHDVVLYRVPGPRTFCLSSSDSPSPDRPPMQAHHAWNIDDLRCGPCDWKLDIWPRLLAGDVTKVERVAKWNVRREQPEAC